MTCSFRKENPLAEFESEMTDTSRQETPNRAETTLHSALSKFIQMVC